MKIERTIVSRILFALTVLPGALLAGCDDSRPVAPSTINNPGTNPLEPPPGFMNNGTEGATGAFTGGPDKSVAYVITFTQATSDGTLTQIGKLEILGKEINLSPTKDSTFLNPKLTGKDANGTTWTVDIMSNNIPGHYTADIQGSNGDTATTVLNKQ